MRIRLTIITGICLMVLSGCAGHRQQGQLASLPSDVQAHIDQESDKRIALQDDARGLGDPPLDIYGRPLVKHQAPLTAAEQKALDSPTQVQFVLDIEETEKVELYFRHFTHDARERFATWLKRSERYLPYVRDVFISRGLPQDLIFLPFIESGYNPMAYSRAGAGGMWQFMPGTGRMHGLAFDWWVDQRRDPYLSTHAAAAYLAKLYEMFDDWNLALAAYNAGNGRISRAMQRSGKDNFFDLASIDNLLARETRHYVPKFMAVLKIVQNLEELGFEPINWNNSPNVVTLQVQGGTDLAALARACGLNWEEFHRLNPAFRRQVSPPGRKMPVYIPEDVKKKAVAFLGKPSARPYEGFDRYQVRRGDSWWTLSNRFNVPVDVLKQINNRRHNTLRVGESLMVPRSVKARVAAASSVEDSRSSRRNLAQQRANYVVQQGDTLWSLSRKFDVAVSSLVQANGLRNQNSLRVGQRLYIPRRDIPGTTRTVSTPQSGQVVQYRVRPGDTLWQIAQRFRVTTANLIAWNRLPRNGLIRSGDNLRIYMP
jgi:membrane-bound lytic murein transglycosylase D